MRIATVLAMAAIGLSACEARAPSSPPISFETTSAVQVEQGRRVSAVLGCSGCHGADLTGEDWSEPGFGRLWTANLTQSAARYTDEELDRIIRTGKRPDRSLWAMPSHLFTHVSADDMAAVIAVIRSKPVQGDLHPDPVFEAGARREMEAGLFMSSDAQVAKEGTTWPPDAGPEHALGRYIVRATCAECHGVELKGGTPLPGTTPPPDLAIIAAYDPAQFQRLLRDGKGIGDRDLGLMSEVARGRYSQFTEAEFDAVEAYLRRVEEIRR